MPFLLPRLLRLLLLLLVVAFAVATARILVWPATDRPGRADAVVVLSGSRGERLGTALDLMRRRVAPVLVISNGLSPSEGASNALCRAGRSGGFAVICFKPDPDSTRGEAHAVRRLVRRNGWRRVVVVTSRYHVTRARLLFDRCLTADVASVAAPYKLSTLPVAIASEWTKLAYALTVERSC